MARSSSDLLHRAWRDLGRDVAEIAALPLPSQPVPLPAASDVAGLAEASVAAASLAAATLAGSRPTAVDPMRIAVSYTSERHFRIGGETPDAFAPLSGFFRTADGWVRTHGNYPWHADALRRALSLPSDAGKDAAAGAFAASRAAAVAAAITGAGGICSPVLPEDPAADAALRTRPLISLTRLGPGVASPLPHSDVGAPLRGIRVLDLTRVIAGPVATRTLALLGADVVRVDPPQLPEIPWQHLDTGHGKRSTRSDARSPAFAGLLARADVVVLGYRPAGLDALGMSPAALTSRHPGLVVARLSAWGTADQRGFDSIVQAASGISWQESVDGDTPGALPAQALDHSAGYLLATAVLTALERRRDNGGSWLVETSLRRIAAELLGMPRTDRHVSAREVPIDPAPHLQSFDVGGVSILTTAPAVAYVDGPTRFEPPRPWGEDPPEWAST